jgi:hypothetical protein
VGVDAANHVLSSDFDFFSVFWPEVGGKEESCVPYLPREKLRLTDEKIEYCKMQLRHKLSPRPRGVEAERRLCP